MKSQWQVMNYAGSDYCFVESFSHESKGIISVYILRQDGANYLGDALIEPFHLSYPFVFQYKSKTYMCPETMQNRDIRIYECEEFPLKWRLHSIAMADVSAVDSTIFEYNDLWWLFTSIDPTNQGDSGAELYIFYADNPLLGSWTPHPNNPVIADSMRARMGGLAFDETNIFRISQQHGFDTYGLSATVNRITSLNRNEYAEEPVRTISSRCLEDAKGTHHLHSNGGVTVFDSWFAGKKYE